MKILIYSVCDDALGNAGETGEKCYLSIALSVCRRGGEMRAPPQRRYLHLWCTVSKKHHAGTTTSSWRLYRSILASHSRHRIKKQVNKLSVCGARDHSLPATPDTERSFNDCFRFDEVRPCRCHALLSVWMQPAHEKKLPKNYLACHDFYIIVK